MIEDIQELFSQLPDWAENMILQIFALIIALLLIWIGRHVVTWAIMRPLQRISSRSQMPFDDKIVTAVKMPMRWFVVAAALLVSVTILDTGDSVTVFVQRLGRSAILIGMMLLFYKLVDIFAFSSNMLFRVTGLSIEERLLPFIRTSIKVLILVIGVLAVMSEWDYDVTGLVAGVGLSGLALSLAAQDTASNLFGFASIIGDRPFDVGDYIVTPDVEGVVEEVGIRSSRIRQLDQALVTIPNSTLANSVVKNWSRLSKRRVDYMLGVTYDSTSEDLQHLLHRVRELLNNWASVEPGSVVVYFMEFGGSSLDILVRCYLTIPDWGEFQAEKEQINLQVMDLVAELGLSVAFPSRSLYLENLPDLARDLEAMSNTRIENERTMLSPRAKALLDEEARAARESAPTPPELSPREARELGSESDMPDSGDEDG